MLFSFYTSVWSDIISVSFLTCYIIRIWVPWGEWLYWSCLTNTKYNDGLWEVSINIYCKLEEMELWNKISNLNNLFTVFKKQIISYLLTKCAAHSRYSTNLHYKKKRMEIWDKKLWVHEHHYLNYGLGSKNLEQHLLKYWNLTNLAVWLP